MEPHPFRDAVNHWLAANEIEPLTSAQASFFNCLIAAAIKNLPTLLGDVMNCMAGSTPPGAGYDPGKRTRCA